VIADTPNNFAVIHDPAEAERSFANLDDHPKIALVTINDDVNSQPAETDQKMREWFDKRWPTPAAWEKTTPPPK
jgi:3-O-alpha-D-mannopyranosyl-alpha-D-mannopyranose xylosylphosphotransferase